VNCSLVSTAAMPVFGILTTSIRKEEGKDLGGLVASERRCDVRGVFHFESVSRCSIRISQRRSICVSYDPVDSSPNYW